METECNLRQLWHLFLTDSSLTYPVNMQTLEAFHSHESLHHTV